MEDYKESINYPFKSKYKYIKDTNIKTEPYIKDYQLKTVKKLSKPDFSFEPHCWEMDIMDKRDIRASFKKILSRPNQCKHEILNC